MSELRPGDLVKLPPYLGGAVVEVVITGIPEPGSVFNLNGVELVGVKVYDARENERYAMVPECDLERWLHE